MSTLATTTFTTEISINTSTGEAHISQRKAAELLGVTQQAIQQRCLSQSYDVQEGLTSEIFSLLVTHYALDSRNITKEAKNLLRQITQAGAKAYLYYLAGYMLGVQQAPHPMTKKELLADIKLDAQIEAVQVRRQVTQLKLQALKDKLAKQSEILNAKTTLARWCLR